MNAVDKKDKNIDFLKIELPVILFHICEDFSKNLIEGLSYQIINPSRIIDRIGNH